MTVTDMGVTVRAEVGTAAERGGLWDALTMVLGVLGAARRRAGAAAPAMDDTDLEAGLRATEGVRRAADAMELTLIAEVNRRGERVSDDGRYREVRLAPGEVADMAPDTVAIAVGTGPYEAGRRCDLAARAATDLAELADLVGEGRLRQRAMEVVAKHTRDTLPETTEAIVAHFLEPRRGRPDSTRIVEMEPHEIAKTCRRLINRLEPDVMQRRADANRAGKLDVRTEPGPLGTSVLSATLPTEVGAAVKSAVDAAGQLRVEDDPDLPVGTARALGLADLVLRGVSVSAEVRLGIPVIASATSRLTFAPVHRDRCTGRCGEPEEIVVLGEGVTSQGRQGGTFRIVTGSGADQVDVLSEEWMPGVTSQALGRRGPDGPLAWISGTTIPGVGFVPPDAVAAITSHLDTRVSRALLDARTGTLQETSSPRYTIPAAQREFVTTRDATCRMWGCTRPVHTTRLGWKADVDHATPWPEGETSPINLSALCRHHHRVKHSPRWRHVLHPDGTTQWLTPGGVPAFTFPVHAVEDLDDVVDAVDEQGAGQRDDQRAGQGASGWSPAVGTTSAPAGDEEGIDEPPF